MKKIKWRRFLPLLYVNIEIPFISIHTELMYERIERDTMEYIVLGIRVYKWIFHIRLYDRIARD
jgi:hypothetical protein